MTEPIPLVAHRCLVWAGRPDGTMYEISRAIEDSSLDAGERTVAITWTPVEARRLGAYLVGMGWHDVRVEKITLADLTEGRRVVVAATPATEERPEMRFAAPGGLNCHAVAATRPEGI